MHWWYGPYKSPHTSLEKWIISTTYSRIRLSLGGYLDVMLLDEFDMTYVIGNAFKGWVRTEHCAHNPMEGREGDNDFLNETILVAKYRGVWNMYFDVASNKYEYMMGIQLQTSLISSCL